MRWSAIAFPATRRSPPSGSRLLDARPAGLARRGTAFAPWAQVMPLVFLARALPLLPALAVAAALLAGVSAASDDKFDEKTVGFALVFKGERTAYRDAALAVMPAKRSFSIPPALPARTRSRPITGRRFSRARTSFAGPRPTSPGPTS